MTETDKIFFERLENQMMETSYGEFLSNLKSNARTYRPLVATSFSGILGALVIYEQNPQLLVEMSSTLCIYGSLVFIRALFSNEKITRLFFLLGALGIIVTGGAAVSITERLSMYIPIFDQFMSKLPILCKIIIILFSLLSVVGVIVLTLGGMVGLLICSVGSLILQDKDIRDVMS